MDIRGNRQRQKPPCLRVVSTGTSNESPGSRDIVAPWSNHGQIRSSFLPHPGLTLLLSQTAHHTLANSVRHLKNLFSSIGPPRLRFLGLYRCILRTGWFLLHLKVSRVARG